jgi:hypothetical protein
MAASVSRCLRELEKRGLIIKVKKGFYAGCRLTPAGLTIARQLAPQFLTGPNTRERRQMKRQARREGIEEEKRTKEMMVAIRSAFRHGA